MLKNTEVVFRRCPNYNNIMNYEIERDDFLTKRLLHYYYDYVVHSTSYDAEEIESVKIFDQALGEYIKKEVFYRKVQTWFYEKKIELEESNYFIEWITSINHLYQDFLKEKSFVTKPTKWL